MRNRPKPEPIICPECVAGKCRNCDGYAWDFERDEPAICECWTRHEGAA